MNNRLCKPTGEFVHGVNVAAGVMYAFFPPFTQKKCDFNCGFSHILLLVLACACFSVLVSSKPLAGTEMCELLQFLLNEMR